VEKEANGSVLDVVVEHGGGGDVCGHHVAITVRHVELVQGKT